MARLGGCARGQVLEDVVRAFVDHDDPTQYKSVDPEEGECVNGKARGKGHEAYDFGVMDLESGRVLTTEVKSSLLGYDIAQKRWHAKFKNVKLGAADQILLVLVGTEHADVFTYDQHHKPLRFYSTEGKATESTGGAICVYGPCNERDPRAAFAAIHDKLHVDDFQRHIAELRYDDPLYAPLLAQQTVTATTYIDVPLASLSGKTRGEALERVVALVLQELYGVSVTKPTPGMQVNGTQRTQGSAECDLVVQGQRAEVKSSMMTWNKGDKCFRLAFFAVKPTEHDLLYLAWMTPRGIHVMLHNGVTCVYTTGKQQESHGGQIVFNAPGGDKGYTEWTAAEAYLLKRMVSYHKLPYLCFLPFGDGDTAHVFRLGAASAKWLAE
jgi:hypothetical protein